MTEYLSIVLEDLCGGRDCLEGAGVGTPARRGWAYGKMEVHGCLGIYTSGNLCIEVIGYQRERGIVEMREHQLYQNERRRIELEFNNQPGGC